MNARNSIVEKNILAVDTTLNTCSVALSYKSVLHGVSGNSEHSQASQLITLIEQVNKESGCNYADYDALVVGIGPGSFTGIRIGVSVARAMRLALNIPCHGLLSLDSVAYAHAEGADEQVQCVLRAGKGQYYHRVYNVSHGFKALSEPLLLSPEQIDAPIPTCGNVSQILPELTWVAESPVSMAEAMIGLYQAAPQLVLDPEPYYIRPADAVAAKPLFGESS